MKKENLIITISQETCSGGKEIADILAKTLKIPCHGSNIYERAAEISKIPLRLFKKYDEHFVYAAYDLLAEDEAGIKLPSDKKLAAAVIAAEKQLGEESSCIFVDKNARIAFEGDGADRLHVFLHASETHRRTGLARELGVSEQAVKKLLKKTDRRRRNYYRSFDRGWGRENHYTMTLDVSSLGIDEAVKQVMGKVHSEFGF